MTDAGGQKGVGVLVCLVLGAPVLPASTTLGCCAEVLAD